METTNTKGNSISLNQINENNYSKLFPSSYLAYFPNDNNNFTISYGKRINRPNFSLLNPFRVIYNSFYVSEGNPFLRPSFSDNIEFAHTFKDNLDSTFFVSFIDNGFGELSKLNNSNQIQQSVWENFLNEFSYGVSQSYYFDFWQWLESFLRYDLSYVEVSSSLPNTIQKRKGVNFDFSVDNTIYFNSDKTFLGQINFWYVSPGVWDNEFYTSSYAIDLGLRWILFDKKVEINFLASDLLKTNKPTYRTTYADIRSEYTSYFDVRFFRLTAIYKFGKTTTQKKRFGNSQESSRIDSN